MATYITAKGSKNVKIVGKTLPVNDPLFSSGLVAPVDIRQIANDLNVSFDRTRHFAIRFRE